ncbi:uncharacterized protein SPPG_02180 [Spizellomyces punctatus DAOM BR117]|uniref:GH18 domain-containing protein n=1 Tax=Spizellomyces punctatus (strain DAOM BR117) TaxID=645134 RepID=A0A0L0HQ94_SPIPD|nr:uncharacterized protein SPPG_02180 [Spizellomyces punctatus DAOM BR117]KND03120.1 hypothetical protein SPPG_02180 [Spizellomyces punctatus DAOM BR117]|eukprot:XP_016611159.1 hypothetical protein SPPG_02180 [Spizellomyces punctatus DAOM BR117]
MKVSKCLFMSWVGLLACIGLVVGAPAAQPAKAANGDYTFSVGVQYTAGQIVDYQGLRYRVVANHISQADWYPGCCAVLWELVGALDGSSAGGVVVPGGVVSGTTGTTVPPGTAWSSRTFAPYVDILLWPTLDVSAVAQTTGVTHYTLAFVFADTAGNPAWGGVTPVSSGFYLDIVSKLRGMGGDVIISFGGAIGQELAAAVADVATLQSRYQAVINKYQLTWADFDIEGPSLLDKASVDRRNQAIAGLQKANPKLLVSYTLPVLPNGLTDDGVYLLKSAVKYGVRVDVVNIMAMDYGSGVAPNGATGMGGYAISAAQATYAQAQAAGLTTSKIGVTPMIGQNDVAGEVFRLEDAKQLVDWAKSVSWVAEISMWSVNRDTSKAGPLYASSQLKQNDYDFVKTLVAFEGGVIVGGQPGASTTCQTTAAATTAVVVPTPPTTPPPAASGWGAKTFAPYVDVLLWPTLDVSAVAQKTGSLYYTLAFITADSAKNPAWGGVTKWSDKFYLDILTKLRALGGDAIISFGGATGTELALSVTDATQLQAKYQSVIDTYQVTWVDFDIEGGALGNKASIDRRNQAIAGLQKANPKLLVSYTLPVLPTGITADGVYLLQSAVKYGVRVDVVNIMAMDYGPAAAPNGATGMGGYAIQAAQATYIQVQSAGLKTTKIGVTPMIGQNDVQGEIFRTADASQLLTWAQQTIWVAELAMWSINRDNSVKGPLYASSQITQKDYEFAGIFKAFNVAATKTVQATQAATLPPLNLKGGKPLTRIQAREAVEPTQRVERVKAREWTYYPVPEVPERPEDPKDLPAPDPELIYTPEKRELADTPEVVGF